MGVHPFPGSTHYASSKAAVIMLTKALALELVAHGIRTNCICPGYVDTPLVRNTFTTDEEIAMAAAIAPMARMGCPEEIADTILFLASDKSSFYTGQVFHPNGGFFCRLIRRGQRRNRATRPQSTIRDLKIPVHRPEYSFIRLALDDTAPWWIEYANKRFLSEGEMIMTNVLNAKKLKLAIPILSFATAIAWTPASIAQDTQGARAIEEIVVHARKKAESLQDTPVSVAAFSAEALERWTITNMSALSDFTPSLVIGEVGSVGGQFISMRGINTGVANALADQSISTLVDGVPFSHASITRIGKVDLQQVEVLKGPQALYFGKNSTGGIVAFRTADPTEETEVQFKVGYEDEAEQRYVQALVSGVLTDTLKARLVGRWSDMEGWLNNTAVANPLLSTAPGPAARTMPQDETVFVRGTLLWEPSDTFTMRTKVTHDTVDGLGNNVLTGYVRCVGPTPAPGIFGYVNTDTCDQNSNDYGYHDIGPGDIALLDRANEGDSTRAEDEMTFVSNEVNVSISDNWDLVSVTGYVEQERSVFKQFSERKRFGVCRWHADVRSEAPDSGIPPSVRS